MTRGLEWAARTQKGPIDASRVVWALGECFFFPSFLKHTNYLFRYYIYSKRNRSLGMGVDDKKKGPNDASRVVWALGDFFFPIVSHILIVYLGTTYILQQLKFSDWRRRQKKGPNDASRVVWALGELFFHCFFYILTIHLGSIYVLKPQEGFGWVARTKKRPKRRDASFGP
jgi:hypothetical protein